MKKRCEEQKFEDEIGGKKFKAQETSTTEGRRV